MAHAPSAMHLAYDRAAAAVEARLGMTIFLLAEQPFGSLASAAALTPEWLLAHTDHLLVPTEAREWAREAHCRLRALTPTSA
jgi:hypothetical protein